MDLSVFCDYLELVCVALCVSWRPWMHHVMLPRTWILRLFHRSCYITRQAPATLALRSLFRILPDLLAHVIVANKGNGRGKDNLA
jgi:hypothetical protein